MTASHWRLASIVLVVAMVLHAWASSARAQGKTLIVAIDSLGCPEDRDDSPLRSGRRR